MAKNNLVTQQGAPVNNAAENLGKGTPLTHAELDNNFFSIYVATNGTAEASKALIVDASKNIGTLGTVTLTDVVINETATFDAEVSESSAAGVLTIDWTSGNKQGMTLTENITSITMTDPAGPCNLQFKFKQAAASSYTVTGWDSSSPQKVFWPGGTAFTMSATNNAFDIISFYFDGTDYYAVASQNFS